MRRRPPIALLPLGALLLGCTVGEGGRRAAAPPAADGPAEWDRELPPGMRVGSGWADEATHRPVRVLDADTGLPIEGARLDNWWEAHTPHAEDWEWYHEQSLVTDPDGWAFASVEAYGNWWCVQADGYLPEAGIGFETEYRLRPATAANVHVVEVRDWLDRPVPGALLDVPFGCGHTASLLTATTDARGRATLRDVDPSWMDVDVWLRADGLAGASPAYGGLHRVPVVDGVHVIRAEPAPVIEGVVLDDEGRPAAGAVVGSAEAHRGPWTEADEHGRFRLVGALPWSPLTVYHRAPPDAPPGTPYAQALVQSAPGVSPTIRLPPPTRDPDVADSDQPEVVTEEGPIALDVRVALTRGSADGAARVVAVGESDGRAVLRTLRIADGRGSVTLPVDVGAWTVTVGSSAGPVRPTTQRITIDDAAPARLDVDAVANPVWVPRIFERTADGALERLIPDTCTGLSVITSAGAESAVASSSVPGAIHVPATGVFVVRFSPDHADHERDGYLVFDAPPAGVGPDMVIPALPDEEPYRSPEPPPAEGAFPESTLTVLLPDGSPAAGARVRVVSDLPPEFADRRTLHVDADGRLDVALRPGDRLTVEHWDGPELESLTATICAPGPWTLRWPQTSIEVRATDEEGRPIDFFDLSCSGDDQEYGEDGVARLWRTTSGPLRLWVSAAGRRGHDLRVVVRPGETRVVAVVLRPDASAAADPGAE